MAEAEQFCQNDGTALVGDYCHTCGQRADEPRRVVIGLVQDFLVDTLAIDGKLARSIWLLLSRPGRLAQRYLVGKRVRYSPPFRLYLFTSVFFFLALFATLSFDREVITSPDQIAPEDAAVLREEFADAPPEARAVVEPIIERAEKRAASGENEDSETDNGSDFSFRDSDWDEINYEGPAWLEKYLKQSYEAAQRAVEDPRLFVAQSRDNVPRALLLAPVFYALILMLLYFYRRKFYVYDHFVVSLYMHAALYAYLLIALLISKIPVFGFLWFAPLVWGWLQPFFVFRQAYESGWVSAVAKWAVSIVIYMIGLALIVTFGITYSLYTA
jgi:hypothetical protein